MGGKIEMTDLKNGIIEINGFTFTPKTTLDEMLQFFGENVRTLEVATGTKVKFLKRYYLTEDLYSYAFNFDDKGRITTFSLIPVVPDSVVDHGYGERAKHKLESSKKWLKEMIYIQPTTDCNEGISYHFKDCHISAFVQNDLHYGMLGGEITVYFDNEV